MQNFKKQFTTQVAITSALVGVLAAGLLFLGGRLNRSVIDIQGLRQELVTRWSSLSMLASLLTTYNMRAEKDMAVLERVIPKRDALLNLSRDLRGLAIKSGVEQTYSFVSETPGGPGALGFVTFQLVITGPNENVHRYLESLNGFTYLSRFETVEMVRSASKSSATMRGKVYFQ